MRLYLDTNILIFMLLDKQQLERTVYHLFADCSNVMYTSEVCVHELIHLAQIGKIYRDKHDKNSENADWVLPSLDAIGVTIVPITRKHLDAYSSLPMQRDHRDPFDRLIIAQAMADRSTLVTSDTKMPWYRRHGLKLIMNER